MDALVERDLASISTQQQGQKKDPKMALDLRDLFLRKAFPTAASTFEPSFSFERKQSRHKKKEQRPMPSTFFFLAATTLVFVGRRVFVGAFGACMTLSMQHGRLNSAILFLAIARRSAFFFKSTTVSIVSMLRMAWDCRG